MLPVLQRHPHVFDLGAMSLEAFRCAASLVGSRAFGINEFHGARPQACPAHIRRALKPASQRAGMSMLPLGDAFNHKAAKVKLSGGFEVAPFCQVSSSSEDDDEAAHSTGVEAWL